MSTFYHAVIFDLDGTLLDTLTDLANSMNAALLRLGFEPHPTDDYRYFVGDGIRLEAQRALPPDHRDEETISKCIAIAAEQYSKSWRDNTKLYPGISQMLFSIEQLGLPKAILSNKPHDFVQIMVKELLSAWTFRIVLGHKCSMPRKPDPAGALQISSELQIRPERILYLGDTNTDMQTASSAGMYPAGAIWGFRSADELLQSGAKTLCKSADEVLKLLT
jgi:phosphoglycolate phosphatase